MVDNTSQIISYNIFLYNKRIELGYRRRKFAKMLKLSTFKYRLIENGYIKPSKRDINKISKALDVDYQEYLEGDSSYPNELPEKDRSKISLLLYRILASKFVRISLLVLSVIFITSFIVATISVSNSNKHKKDYYSENILSLTDYIKENGKLNFSLLGETKFPEISNKYTDTDRNIEKLTMISSTYSNDVILNFRSYYWSDTYRVTARIMNIIGDEIQYSIDLFLYSSSEFYASYAYVNPKESSIRVNYFGDDEYKELVTDMVVSFLSENDLIDDFDFLIKNTVNPDYDFLNDVLYPFEESEHKFNSAYALKFFIIAISIIFGALSIFLTAYAYIYGSKEKKVETLSHSDELLLSNILYKPLKKDMRFIPFLPETILEIIGILIVAIGSFRIVIYASQINEFSSSGIEAAGGDFLSIRMLGMFLLYFIDFDLFMDDKRVLRNIVMYPLLFLIIYYVEALLMTSLANSNSILLSQFTTFLMPNPFGTITCYFLIMMFLFFTPKFVKNKKSLIIYRLLAIIPIIYIIVSFFLFNSDFFFDWKIDNFWVRYLFNSERLPFSILAVTYLVGLYLIRLFFKKKYGEERAQKFFSGNKFIFLKNILISLVVVIVWIVDLILSKNTGLSKIGIGVNQMLIILVPLLLLYHPHKGPRNLAVDYTTLGLYFFSISYAYVLAFFEILVVLAQ